MPVTGGRKNNAGAAATPSTCIDAGLEADNLLGVKPSAETERLHRGIAAAIARPVFPDPSVSCR
jgi:hypothetical protein